MRLGKGELERRCWVVLSYKRSESSNVPKNTRQLSVRRAPDKMFRDEGEGMPFNLRLVTKVTICKSSLIRMVRCFVYRSTIL